MCRKNVLPEHGAIHQGDGRVVGRLGRNIGAINQAIGQVQTKGVSA